MSDLIAIQPKNDPYVSITWQVNNFCNYRCSYCNEGNWSGTYTNENKLDILVDNLQKIIDHYRFAGYVNFKVFYSGGEPTLWKGLIPVSEFLKKSLGDHVTLGINTNLSRKIGWWEKNYHLFDDVVASYHPEFANKNNYFEIAEFLQDKINYLCLRMMMVEEKFDEMVLLGNEFKSRLKNYNLEWVPLLNEMSIGAVPWEYNDPRITEFLSKNNFETNISIYKPKSKLSLVSIEKYNDGTTKILNSNRIIAENKNFFKGWRCKVNEAIFISPSGSMKAASCGQGPMLGNIFSNFEITSESIICQKDYCHCGTDILISKEK
jgi:organic radical activating enzyme